MVATIVLLSRRMVDPLAADPTRPFDAVGAILSGVGMFCVVFGILQAGSNNALFAIFLAVGAVFLLAFFLFIRARERAGKEPLLSTGLFKNRTCNLALVTQNIQWLLLMGTSFVVSVFLQEVRGYSAIKTGVIFTAATLGILVSVLAAERLAKRYPQRTLIVAGFVVTSPGSCSCSASSGLGQHLGVRARAAADRPRPGRDAHPLGERRAVELPRGAAGRDLGPVAERLQPRLVVRHRDRRPILVSLVANGNSAYGWAMVVLILFGIIGLSQHSVFPAEIERA